MLSVLASLVIGQATTQKMGTPIYLFNTRDLKGWHADVPERDKKPTARMPFIVRDKKLVSLGTPGGHSITDRVYENYRLEIEYRFSATPGNCGVLVHASTPRRLYEMFPQSMEVQMQSGDAGDFWCIGEDIVVPWRSGEDPKRIGELLRISHGELSILQTALRTKWVNGTRWLLTVLAILSKFG